LQSDAAQGSLSAAAVVPSAAAGAVHCARAEERREPLRRQLVVVSSMAADAVFVPRPPQIGRSERRPAAVDDGPTPARDIGRRRAGARRADEAVGSTDEAVSAAEELWMWAMSSQATAAEPTRVLNRTPNADVVVTPDADLVGHPVRSGSGASAS
jgi:hypothetical protein